MVKQNIEIQNARQTVDLLKLYSVAKKQEEQDALLEQIHSVNYWAYVLLTKYDYDAVDLADKINQAIKLDAFRPKNMSVVQMAISHDLEYINGDFNTFDQKLSQMEKTNQAPEKIRDRLKCGLGNIHILSEQFSVDWIQRLKKHPKLVNAARNANKDTAVDAYNKLFAALTQDFCQEYNCLIESQVVTAWTAPDGTPDTKSERHGYHQEAYSLSLSDKLSQTERDKIIADFSKNPTKTPGARRKSFIKINITKAHQDIPDSTDFFYHMISLFAHEMHHALDYQNPRAGALGPQINNIDKKHYKNSSQDTKAYYESVTEISSYEIQRQLFNQLKNTRF